MKIQLDKASKSNIWLFFIIIMIVLFKAYPLLFDENMVAYSAAELHFYDNSLYPNNLDVILNEHSVSPRFISFLLFYVLMKVGLTYEWAYIFIYLSTCFLTAIAIFYYSKKALISTNLHTVILLSFFTVFSIIGYYAGFNTFDPQSLFMGLGTSFSTFAVVLSLITLKRNDPLPYFLVVCAALAHVHEGIWGFAIVSILLFIKNGFSIFKNYGFYIAIISILSVTIPTLLTSGSSLSSSDFYNIYVLYRVPHHLYFWDSFPSQFIVQLLSYAIIYYFVRKYGESKNDERVCLYLGGVFILTIVVWYATCELMHISFFMKLYISKFIKYINIVFTLLLCKSLSSNKVGKSALLFLLSSLLIYSYFADLFIFALPALLLLFAIDRIGLKDKFKDYIFLGLTIFFILIGIKAQSLLFVGLIAALTIVLSFKKYNYFSAFFVLLSFLIVIIGKPIVSNPDLNYTKQLLAKQTGRDLCVFSERIASFVPKEKIILADYLTPESGFLQHISRRDIYVLHKAAPSNEAGVLTWFQRIKEVENMNDWDSKQYEVFMKANSIDYLVLNSDSVIIDLSDRFEEVTKEGRFTLYYLNNKILK